MKQMIPADEIPWNDLIKNRPIVMKTIKGFPKYLLAPEIEIFLNSCDNQNYKFLFYTMWLSGGRVSEVLALTPQDFYLEDFKNAHIMLPNLKASEDQTAVRYIPLRDELYISNMAVYLRARQTQAKKVLKRDEPIWKITRGTAYKKVKCIAEELSPAYKKMSPQTFRHSFAINCFIHDLKLEKVADLLGHTSLETTRIYTRVLTHEIAHLMNNIKFSGFSKEIEHLEGDQTKLISG